jgi:ATP-dependent DNA helicase RecG
MKEPSRDCPDWLLELLSRTDRHEDVEIECKRASGGLPKDLWETLSAFANTRGGRIVLGVDERQGFAPEGVPNVDARLKELWDGLRNPQKVSGVVCSEGDVTVETVEGKSLLVIRVPAAPRRDRPVYLNNNPYLGTYVRRHSADYRCDKAEVDRMIREASGATADSAIVAEFSLDDLDRDALTSYRNRFQTRDPASPWNGYDDARFLKALGGMARDRANGVEGITVAGLLMFGRPETIREWRGRHLIDYRRLPGPTDVQERWVERIAWEGNLFGAFFAIYPRLIADQPIPFQLVDGVRTEHGPLHDALREALVNLLVHADYTESDASLILRSADGFLFRNPGSSRVPEDDMLIGNRSDPRNPSLALMFRKIGLAEEAGTGIPKIIQVWREMGFQLPGIQPGSDRYEFTIELRYAHLLSDEDRRWLQSLGSQWSEAEQISLVMARHEGWVDNLRLRSLTGLHSADATSVLTGLRERGLLQQQGGGRGT